MLRVLSFIIFFLFSLNTFADAPQASFVDWSVFTVVQDGQKVCYIASLPIKESGTYRKRGEPFMMVTRIAGNDYDEVSVSSGYPYKKDKSVEVSIDKRKFNLFAYEDRAWAEEKYDDIEMVKAMKNGFRLIVSGTSGLDNTSEDIYSLIGFTDAHNKMVELCK